MSIDISTSIYWVNLYIHLSSHLFRIKNIYLLPTLQLSAFLSLYSNTSTSLSSYLYVYLFMYVSISMCICVYLCMNVCNIYVCTLLYSMYVCIQTIYIFLSVYLPVFHLSFHITLSSTVCLYPINLQYIPPSICSPSISVSLHLHSVYLSFQYDNTLHPLSICLSIFMGAQTFHIGLFR